MWFLFDLEGVFVVILDVLTWSSYFFFFVKKIYSSVYFKLVILIKRVSIRVFRYLAQAYDTVGLP